MTHLFEDLATAGVADRYRDPRLEWEREKFENPRAAAELEDDLEEDG